MTQPPALPPFRAARDSHAEEERDRRSLAEFLRLEVSGGLMLLIAAALALGLANSPLAEDYFSLRDHHLDIPALGLELSVGHWASDGLLAIFFFIAGIELKRELVVGELRRPAAAVLPVVAAVGGMVVPALIYVAVAVAGDGDTGGWAVPMATDIAFALGVLAVVGRHLPSALRTFLLTLAIVDDLIAIIVIAIFFTSDLNLLALLGALAGLALFYVLHRRGVTGWYIYVPLALLIWGLMYNSGVHATIAGVAIGMLLRTTAGPLEKQSPAERVEHLVHPYSAGLAVPLFALFAAGVEVSPDTFGDMVTEPEALGVVLGLFAGKVIGVFGATFLAARFTKARLNPALTWPDMFGAAMLAGIGFTVSLLIAELAFTGVPHLEEHVKVAVLIGSLLSAVCAGVLLTLRGRVHRAAAVQDTSSPSR
ncbi:Na+/H+ antiporter NhaA [Streptomyces litchfieldiae]|uniref:Na(+)/H(+) antiporter NhaA n=1 Tax=Streptomyces litchfieldiae TaxID=3075543 RepID=A0ABU2MMT6_9ACTN|nr:Na+/H+ antiporter NhaA [Streptomyces sp. DSM 44938]MDT0342919.1 Na+/H+ antiporter NhaA [Streptomyces sp. DSM 44938]